MFATRKEWALVLVCYHLPPVCTILLLSTVNMEEDEVVEGGSWTDPNWVRVLPDLELQHFACAFGTFALSTRPLTHRGQSGGPRRTRPEPVLQNLGASRSTGLRKECERTCNCFQFGSA